MQETGCSEKQCERDFEIYSPFLGELLDLFNNHFRNDEITATSSITAILECKNWDKEGEALVARLEAILANLKLPKYNKLVSSKEDEFVKTKKLLKKSKK